MCFSLRGSTTASAPFAFDHVLRKPHEFVSHRWTAEIVLIDLAIQGAGEFSVAPGKTTKKCGMCRISEVEFVDSAPILVPSLANDLTFTVDLFAKLKPIRK